MKTTTELVKACSKLATELPEKRGEAAIRTCSSAVAKRLAKSLNNTCEKVHKVGVCNNKSFVIIVAPLSN